MHITGEKLVGTRFIVQFADTGLVFIPGTGSIQAHLKILIVHVNFMKGEFNIAINGDLPGPFTSIMNSDIEDFHGIICAVFKWNQQRLRCVDAIITTGES